MDYEWKYFVEDLSKTVIEQKAQKALRDSLAFGFRGNRDLQATVKLILRNYPLLDRFGQLEESLCLFPANLRSSVREARETTRRSMQLFGRVLTIYREFCEENDISGINERARKYQMWIATEVLPTVRKHGIYATDQIIDRMVEDPDFGIQLLTTLKEEKAKRKELEHENSVMKPKAEYFDALVDRNLLTSFRDTAKELGIRERKFLDFLMEKKYIYRDQSGKLRPFAEKNGGLFELKEFNNNGHPGVQTMITPKGKETFRLLLEKDSEVTA